MKIQRLKLEQVRRFRQLFEIAELKPGINIFTGPNGAGKSTIVRAIRAAFLEKHRSNGAEDLRPMGDSSAAPFIEVAFELNGENCLLTKQFLQKKRCDLQLGRQRFDGEEAEDKLAELLGFEIAARGASKAEHWGIPGLLWIEQGAGHEINSSVAFAVDHLRSALNQSLGEMASTSGDDVLARVTQMRDELLTSTGRPRNQYLDSCNTESRLVNELVGLQDKIGVYQQQVDKLGRLMHEHACDSRDRPWDALREQQREVAAQLEALNERMKQLAPEKERLKNGERHRDDIQRQLGELAKQEERLAQRKNAFELAAEQLPRIRESVERITSRRETAQTDYDQARELQRLAREQDRRLQRESELNAVQAQLTQLESTISKAEHAQQMRNALRDGMSGRSISKDDMATLQQQADKLRELKIRSESIATRIRYDLMAGRNINIGKEALSGSGEQLLLAATAINIPEFGNIEIIPGGEDVGNLARKQDEVREAHQALLDVLGFASVMQAKERFDELIRFARDLEDANDALANLAPEGVSALQERQRQLQEKIAALQEELQGLSPVSESIPSLEDAEAQVDRVVEQGLAELAELLRRDGVL